MLQRRISASNQSEHIYLAADSETVQRLRQLAYEHNASVSLTAVALLRWAMDRATAKEVEAVIVEASSPTGPRPSGAEKAERLRRLLEEGRLTGRDAEIARAVVAGESYERIGERLGISRGRVSQLVNRMAGGVDREINGRAELDREEELQGEVVSGEGAGEGRGRGRPRKRNGVRGRGGHES